MSRSRWRGIGTPSNQLLIDWNAAEPQPVAISPTLASPEVPSESSLVVPPATAIHDPAPSFVAKVRRSREGVVVRLPGPKPLPAAVAAGRFGYDEEGRPIRPAADEVRAITDSQAEKLIALLDAVTPASGKPVAPTLLPETYHTILAAYGQDFGERAARQLETDVRRQASLDESDRAEGSWRR